MTKLMITAIASAIALAFSAGAMATSMSKDDYKCDTFAGDAKNTCVKEAKVRFGQL